MEIKQGFRNDRSSLHILHDVATERPEYVKFNSHDAIAWDDLVNGIESGRYPRIAAITAPAFGLEEFKDGAILSPDKAIRDMAQALHTEAIEKALFLKEKDLGEGIDVWWPAFDSYSERWTTALIDPKEAWNRLVQFWANRLCETGGTVHLEWKPSVPGDRDYINSICRAIRFCQEVNELVGRTAMVINNEWAHLLIGGTTVTEGTRQTINAGLFTDFAHVNSAELAVFKVNEETGMPLLGTPGDDKDWTVGAGGEERWTDQEQAVKLMLNSGMPQLILEHDLDPAGSDPLEYYQVSRDNLERMIASARS